MSKKFLVSTLALAFVLPSFVLGQNTVKDQQAVIVQLQEQIKVLQIQITSLTKQIEGQSKEIEKIKTEVAFTQNLQRGMTGDEVKKLQEFLKQFPDIYPEGLITGYYGTLTETAVRKLQEKQGLPAVGFVGPKTLEKLNELTTQGAGSSGTIPPGLLIAPGIAKKIEISATATSTVLTIVPQATTTLSIPAITATTTTSATAIPATVSTPVSSSGSGTFGAGATTATSSSATTTTPVSTTQLPPSSTSSTSSLSPPPNFAMTPGSPGSLNFSWSALTNNVKVTGYRVYVTNTNTNITTTYNYDDGADRNNSGANELVQGAQYSSYIVAHDALGNISAPSPTVYLTVSQLTKPTNFNATATNSTSVSLSWSASQGIVYRYQIRRFTGSLNGAQTSAIVLAPATSYTDTTVQPNATYIYWIEAMSVEYYSSGYASLTITTSSTPPTPDPTPDPTSACLGGNGRTQGFPNCLMPENLAGTDWNEVDNATGKVLSGAVCSVAVCGRNGEWRNARNMNGTYYPNGYPPNSTYIQTPFDVNYGGQYFTNGVWQTSSGGIVQPGSSQISMTTLTSNLASVLVALKSLSSLLQQLLSK